MSDRSKLPMWARHLITKLEDDVEYWRKLAMQSEDAEADTHMLVGATGSKPLGVRPTILFGGLDNRDSIEVKLLTDTSIMLRASWDRLTIQPISSNVIRVRSTHQ